MALIKKLLFIVSLLSLTYMGSAQNRDELEQKRKNLIQDISYTNDLLKKNTQQKKLTVSQLAIISQKIDLRQSLIYQLENDLDNINRKILENQIIIESLKGDLEQIKEEYSKLIYYAYKNRSSYDRLMFVFSSKDFNQAYLRLKYFRQYNEYRRKQAESIEATQTIISEKISELNIDKDNKEGLLGRRKTEKVLLAEEENNQKSVINRLSQKESQLKQDLKAKALLAEKLQDKIQQLIAEEIAKSKKHSSFDLTPEQKLISDNFASNKNRLPWPTKRGIVTEKFGEHPHPVLKGINIRNNGIDISTNPGEIVRTVFSGEVKKIFIIPGLNRTCIIRHGKYLTVYSNLDDVFVKVGENVDSKQTIGIVHTDSKEGIGTFKFQVWRENEKLNPEDWLAGR